MYVIFFDTRNGTQVDTATDATLDVFYQYPSDLGQTWQETRVTPVSFTTPTLVWGNYFLTDYISMSVTNNDIYLAFPWSNQADHMDMYFAKKLNNRPDIIFTNGFE